MRPALLLAFLTALLLCGAARAGTPPDYESRLIARALQATHLTPLPPEAAEGRPLEAVHVYTEDIVGPADPWPGLLNLVHVRTREQVVRREVLLVPGGAYASHLAEETERNLRRLFLFAVSRVVPVEGSQPGTVAVLVATKDLWSLRLNSSYRLVGTLLQSLTLRPTEQNFLGLGQQLSLELSLRLDTLRLGAAFANPRLLGTRLSLSTGASVVLNRETGRVEGSAGNLTLQQPLYSLATPWAYGVSGAWNVRVARIYQGAGVLQLAFPSEEEVVARVPYVYDVREAAAAAFLTRSFGEHFKTDVSVALGAYGRRFAAPATVVPDEAQRVWLAANYLPRSEDATYLGLSARFFEARYGVLRNFDTFALSEDVQLGPSLRGEVRLAPALLPGTQAFVDTGWEAGWRQLLGADGLLRLRAAASLRAGSGLGVSNRRVDGEVLVGTPSAFGLRLVHRTLVDWNVDSLFERVQLLGGSNGLRGLAPEALQGRQVVLLNTEVRTLPVELLTLHGGLVLFWDAGTAKAGQEKLVHTVGLGLRLLFPQFDREPVRIDLGWVLNAPQPDVLGRLSSTFGQVTDEHPSFLDRPLP